MAIASAFLAVAGHIAGGAPLPRADAVFLVLLFLVPACWAVMSGQRRTMTLAAISITVQAFAHTVFSLCCPSDAGAPAASTWLLDWRMITAHVAATVATASVLARGDALVWLLFRFTVQRLAAFSVLIDDRVPVPPMVVVATGDAGAPLRTQWRHCSASRRGPPGCLPPA